MPAVNRDTVEEFWTVDILRECRKDAEHVSPDDFLAQLGMFLGTSGKFWPATSARAALLSVLRATARSGKSAVLACSFNCQVVADAILQAGGTVETYDLADHTGRIDWHGLAAELKPHHNALIIPHLFGVPADFRPIQAAAARLGIWIVEDCAPTLGGQIGDAMAGTVGDAAVFSFNYDKPISLGGGGALLVNNPDLWRQIQVPQQKVILADEEKELDAFVAYLAARRSRLASPPLTMAMRIMRGIKSRLLPGKTTTAFPCSGIGPLRAALGIWQLQRYPQIVAQRNANANFFADRSACRSWHVAPTVRPAWLRQKLIPTDTASARQIAYRLQQQGIRVGLFNWPITLEGYLGRAEKPFAHYVAQHALDVPIHQKMTQAELVYIHEVICSEAVA